MEKENSIKQYFGVNLAELLSDKIISVYPGFDHNAYIQAIAKQINDIEYSQRIEYHAKELSKCLPNDYVQAIRILTQILGEENPNETGMFKNYYWIMPIGKFVELYGIDDFDISMQAIGEITKRSTGEYAIRPFLRTYPDKAVDITRESPLRYCSWL